MRTDVVIVGAGQAGLAMSRELSALGIEHVVLERGHVGQRWRTRTWDTLRLLTPNWMTRLPDWQYRGPDPDGYMPRDAIIRFFSAYAGAFAMPVIAETPVSRIAADRGGFAVETPNGNWRARAVVIATGHCEEPGIPASAAGLDRWTTRLHSSAYRNPKQLPPGNVLVVGASASGVQIAHELAESGRAVTLAVGRHNALPRRLYGRDIFWWLDAMGYTSVRAADVPDIEAARAQPALQLAGREDGISLDLATLQRAGIRLVGHFSGAERRLVHLAGDLEQTVRQAERKRDRLIGEIAAFAKSIGLGTAEPGFPRNAAVGDVPERLDLGENGISSIVWATGFRRNFSWLDVPVVRTDGELIHEDGVLPVDGLYALGFRFMRRRSSSFIDGVGADAAFIAGRIAMQFGIATRAA
jgi:putative flavoprotein involved in K+ transport